MKVVANSFTSVANGEGATLIPAVVRSRIRPRPKSLGCGAKAGRASSMAILNAVFTMFKLGGSEVGSARPRAGQILRFWVSST